MAMQPMNNVASYRECTELLDDGRRLRETAKERGYLYFRSLFPPDDLLAVRKDVLEVTARHGFIQAGTNLDDGIVRDGTYVSERDPTPPYHEYYKDLQRIRSFHALAHHPALLRVLDQLFGEPVLVHPRHIFHAIFPGRKEHTTAPHQDFHPVRGTPDTWTVWTPLGDCAADLGGGLGIVSGSNKSPMLMPKPHSHEIPIEPDANWVWSPMTCGDTLMFHSLAIHQGKDIESTNQIRFSTSFRYQAASQPIDENSLKPHMGSLDWEQVYAKWAADDPLKYYWRRSKLNVLAHWRNTQTSKR